MLSSTREKIEHIKTNPAVIDIDLSNEELGDEGATLLAEALTGRQLRRLYLSNCKMSDVGFASLIPVINASPELKYLGLSGQGLDLSQLIITTLVRLEMENCQVDETKWKAISVLIENNKKLDCLELGQNPLTLKILQDLQKYDDWGKLTLSQCNLTLNECKIFIPNIIENPTSIDVTENQFSNLDWLTEVTWTQISAKTNALVNSLITSEMKNTATIIEQKTEKISQLEKQIIELESKLEETNLNLKEITSTIKSAEQFINDILFSASKSGNLNLARTALLIGADLSAIDPETGETALSLSLLRKHYDIAEMFLQKDAKVITYPNKQGLTPIEESVKNNDSNESAVWLWNAIKKQKPEKERKTEYNNLYAISSDKNKSFLATDKLWEAAKTGNLDNMKEVLDENELHIDINQIHPIEKETLLYQVVYNKHDVDMARYLLSKGADYNIKSYNYDKKIPLNTISNENEDNNKEVTYNNAESSFELACSMSPKDKSAPPLVKLFSSQDVFKSIGKQDFNGMCSALTTAERILHKSSAILEELNFDGHTALHLASLNPDPTFMEKLLDTLSDNDPILETKNGEEKTALHLAVEQQNEKVVGLLLKKGANINAKDILGQIPLHKAVAKYNYDNEWSEEEKNPSIQIIKCILAKHASCNVAIAVKDRSEKQLTPLKLAMELGYEDLANNLGVWFGECKSKFNNPSSISSANHLQTTGLFSHNSSAILPETKNLELRIISTVSSNDENASTLKQSM